MAGKVAVVMGSDSDLPVAERVIETLEFFEIEYDVSVMSAHRSPEKAWNFATAAAEEGFSVIIGIAGGAAALPGMIASATHLPVIAVPVPTDVAGGLDSLLSGVQMPGGVPVLSTGTSSGGAVNAAVAAARILALSDEGLAGRLGEYREALARKVEAKDEKVKSHFAGK